MGLFEKPTLVDLGSIVVRTLGGCGGYTADVVDRTGCTSDGIASARTSTGSTPTR
jgi:hypothetical protein